jgi:uncharacterized membrane protein
MKKKQGLYLLLIVLVAFFLRVFRLSHESFWRDELVTMIGSDPHASLHYLFLKLRTYDIHPPLFYLSERVIFFFFGSSEFTGRILPALAGTASVWAMYLFGKEILNKDLGLTAAVFTCVNYYNLHYSREARDYIFCFLFTVLSFVFLIRLIRHLRSRDSLYYALFALLAMYSHYYGNFLVVSQFCVAFVLLFFSGDRRTYISRFFLSALVIVIGYAPWIPFILGVSNHQSFWKTPGEDFIFSYFNEYLGNSASLTMILGLLLLYYVMNVFRSEEPVAPAHAKDPLRLSFVVFTVSLVIMYMIPYIQSVLTVPVLYPRYTIVVLPILLAAGAYGVELMPNALTKAVITWTFTAWSLIQVFATDGMYTTLHNSQFREMTAFMARDARDAHYPVIDENDYNWLLSYYNNQFHYPGPLFPGPLPVVLDSLLHERSPKYRVNGFWLVSSFVDRSPGSIFRADQKAVLDSTCILAKEGYWVGARARLYLSKRPCPNNP